ncbi:MAG: S1 family peptidase [Acidobacteria bacterium]|nr:S1 family peptidase [Acidobacteriota bacterium]
MSLKLTLALVLTLGCYAPQASAIIVGGTDPNNPVYLSGNTAVGFLNAPGAGVCSGSLLNTGMHFLTAAHCILNATSATVSFINSNNVRFDYASSALTPHSQFNSANYFGGNDIAIITLSQIVDSSINRLSLYTGTGEVGQVGTIIGRGGSGTGTSGGNIASGTRREGTNMVDQIIGNNILFYDFDDGSSARNSTGTSTMTARESMIYFGDSGGPTLINGRIAGVHSFITCVGGTTTQCASGLNGPDLDGTINGTFGERFGDTRVSFYVSCIESITGPMTSGSLDPIAAPEPSTIAAGCVAALICLARYRKARSGSAS